MKPKHGLKRMLVGALLALTTGTGAGAEGILPDHFGSNGDRVSGGWYWLRAPEHVAELWWESLPGGGDVALVMEMRSEAPGETLAFDLQLRPQRGSLLEEVIATLPVTTISAAADSYPEGGMATATVSLDRATIEAALPDGWGLRVVILRGAGDAPPFALRKDSTKIHPGEEGGQ